MPTGRWGQAHNLAAILSLQHERVVANDYTVRFENRCYQLGKPIYSGGAWGQVVIELRLDGTMAIRFRRPIPEVPGDRAAGRCPGGRCPPDPPKFTAFAADASWGQRGRPAFV